MEKSQISKLEEALRNIRAARDASYEVLSPEDRIALDTTVAGIEEALEIRIFARL